MNTHPQNALRILQLLLRCGMVCQEELNVVLDMMPPDSDNPATAVPVPSEAAGQRREAPEAHPRQNALILDFD